MEEIVYRTEKRIDTKTAPHFAKDLEDFAAQGKFDIVIDMSETEYISSVGLRAFLSMQKKVNANNGKMIIKNVQDGVREVFDITGFSGLLTVEK